MNNAMYGDPLFFLEDAQLLRFFRRMKTEMSLMEKPLTFIAQLRDYDLIPDEDYKKMSRMKSKDNLVKALYRVLDWFETKRSKHIKDFWKCVFTETIMTHYPKLQMMHKSLMDGSFQFEIQQTASVEEEEEEADEGKRKEPSEDEEGEGKKVKKKRKLRSTSLCDDDGEQAGPSSQVTAGQTKKSKKLHFSPMKKGEKGDIWTWALYKTQLPVTCGPQKGTLNRDRLAKGEKCIVVDKQWYTPGEFERFAGKESFRNWKLSIRCAGTPLGKLIQDGHLKAARYKGGCKMAKKSLFSSDNLITVSEGEEDEVCEEDEEENQVSSSSKESTDGTDEEGEVEEQSQQPEAGPGRSKKVFKVTCGALTATLHKERFASGTRGKSVRTETSWMTPMEFVKKASGQTSASWRKDITWEGKSISILTQAKILKFHSLLCKCRLCKPDSDDEADENNDDECCICKSEEEGQLVVCDHCPRAFHQTCHLPHVADAILGDSDQWMCTFCLFRSYQDSIWSELTREEAMSSQISQTMPMLRCQYLLLDLCCADEEQTFATNPTLYLSDYRTVVKTPMWLGKVADKLQTQLYKTVGEFVSDVQLIFTNCASYNRSNAEFLGIGARLKEFFDEDFNNVFNIREPTVGS